jgi:hypothetical protein
MFNNIGPKQEHKLKGASIGQVPALLANIRLCKKGLRETNTLAYFKQLLIATVKSLIR